MLRLIALALVLPLIAEAQLSDPQSPPQPYEWRPEKLRTPELKPDDVAVSSEEHALRDFMPGWVPCRPLTEDEMAWADSPHPMKSGGFFFPGKARGMPVIPAAWTPGWPEPGPLLATGVPRGWWWRPEKLEWFGSWLVLAQGDRSGHRFYTLVTFPMNEARHGSVPEKQPILALYTALRDREAKRRGVDPVVLDAESERLARGGSAAPPSVIDQALEQTQVLVERDAYEEAATLLAITLDDGGGTDDERLRGLMRLARLSLVTGRYADTRAAFTEARPLAERLRRTKSLAQIDAELANLSVFETQASWARQAVRGMASLRQRQYAAAIPRFRAAAEGCPPGTDEALGIRWRLAVALDQIGDAAGAQAQATQALALAERLGDDEVAARMKLMLKRLGADGND